MSNALNAGGTFSTALLRGLYVAILAGLAGALPVYATTDDHKTIVVAFAGPFLAGLGARGLVEGAVDAGRQRAGDVKPADVQAVGSGKP